MTQYQITNRIEELKKEMAELEAMESYYQMCDKDDILNSIQWGDERWQGAYDESKKAEKNAKKMFRAYFKIAGIEAGKMDIDEMFFYVRDHSSKYYEFR